ncbi:hypothetical protein [Butyrivibrio fibrisolvens]|uniref:hypothetical protein n=1 Tax=Butyrivibrio fibrisolvens TaxID=831 RepID=UPI0003B43281|nr:hypothetical protein [Butyrivibrio fibrisolvens]
MKPIESSEDMSLDKTIRGWIFWKKMKNKYNLSNEDGLFIFDSKDVNFKKHVEKWIESFSTEHNLKKSVLVSREGYIQFNCVFDGLYIEYVPVKTIKSLLSYYKVVQFTKNIYPLILEPPFSNDHMVGYRGLGYEEYLKGMWIS